MYNHGAFLKSLSIYLYRNHLPIITDLKYCSIALQMEHCFSAITLHLKFEFYIFNWKYIFKPNTIIKNIFGKFACIFINAVIGWNFNILNVLGQIIFPLVP